MGIEIRGAFPYKTFRKESGYPVIYEVGDSCGRDWTFRLGSNGFDHIDTPPTYSLDDFILTRNQLMSGIRRHWSRNFDPHRTAPAKPKEENPNA